MPIEHVFSYGLNMNRSHLRSWLEAAGHDSSLILNVCPAFLEGYDYVWNYYSTGQAGGIPNIEPVESGLVWGALIAMDDVLLGAFDRKEGHPAFFSREDAPMTVTRADDKAQTAAWVYRAAPNRRNRRDIWPTREVKNTVLNGAVELPLPSEAIEKIRDWPTSR
jgi:hypothetical protein